MPKCAPLFCCVQPSNVPSNRCDGDMKFFQTVFEPNMVHQNPLVLNEGQRKVLESGGGTAETTRAVRLTIGKNFEDYCSAREEEWGKPLENAPDWWSNADGRPRSMKELVSDQCLPVFRGYLKNWLWEMQVLSLFMRNCNF